VGAEARPLRPGFWAGAAAGIVPASLVFLIKVMVLADIDVGLGMFLAMVGTSGLVGIALLGDPRLGRFGAGLLAGSSVCFVVTAAYVYAALSSL
jgi:hypothetical protein